jgi:ferredoxin
MDSQLRAQVVFHLTGRRPDAESGEGAIEGLSPALLAAYRNLDSLRHDFPVVFAGGGERDYVQSVSQVVDRALRKVAPEGVQGEGMRRRVLGIEKRIRADVAAGANGTLLELWDKATAALAAKADAAFAKDAQKARNALGVDGEVAGCDVALPARFMRHAWSVVQHEKVRAARERIDSLTIRLGEILRADYMRSEQALEQPALKASFGAAHHGLFDFAAMSRLLQTAGPQGGLDERRRRRVEQALEVIEAQRFFAPIGRSGSGASGPVHEFAFADPGAALDAFLARLPELVELLKALQVAELEVEGNYREELHDPIFAAFGEDSITPQDLQFFPDYLVCLERRDRREPAHLAQALSSGVPLKVMVQVDDLLEDASPGRGRFAFGLRSSQLASAAMSFDEVFVLQTAASNLLQLKARVHHGLRHPGAALFSIYAGTAGSALPAYLVSAAAMQSRAFPAFSYDPAAGPDLAARFSLENNPQPGRDWPAEKLSYADQDLQSVIEEVAFTFADFVACDPRYAGHFAPVPRAEWGDAMIPLDAWLENPPQDAAQGVPYVLAVDDADLMCRLVVDERLVRAAMRCREGWHRLQELGGVRDSRAEQLLARERAAWEEQHQRELQAATAVAAAASAAAGGKVPSEPATLAAASPAPNAAEAAAAEPARNPDEPYIETIRCSTCNECTQINPRMFNYNENKQACIADLKAGTYAQMVEAAESCQVSIIHPGKPWNPQEPGLAELIERAKPFQ